ncbi:O-antigen ligase [Deinococcus sp. RL]|uniref:O-antigen ligase family protein n=1 Tax=Deinococcus sp. RL TaxID=1489678 RepID=UPI001378FAE1|nr:O-antigen ligase family protein [Deinococcus sp. RL]
MTLTYIIGLSFTFLSISTLGIGRLTHPYMTSVSLGLAGAFGVWLALFAPGGQRAWRWLFGLTALAVLLLAGSRGPLIAAFIGSGAALIVSTRRRTVMGVVLGGALVAAGFYTAQRLEFGPITRLASTDSTGRDVVWENTLSVVRAYPWSGVGSYRLGKRLGPPGQECELFASVGGETPACPPWLARLGRPWLIAHNAALQQLAETGPLGLLGLGVLLGAVLVAAVQAKQPLGLAIVTGLLVTTMSDNTLLVPSPFFAEVFWVVAGVSLTHLRAGAPVGPFAAGLLLLLSFPIWSRQLSTPLPAVQAQLLYAPRTLSDSRDYNVFLALDAPPGEYRVALNSCTDTCRPIAVLNYTHNAVEAAHESAAGDLLNLQGHLDERTDQRLQLLIFSRSRLLNPQPIAQIEWHVRIDP